MLLAYAKMSLDHELLASDLPDAAELAEDLRGYFPAALRERLAAQIAAHPLRREITATVVTNDLVNRAGITFVHDMRARTGRAAPEVARGYRIVREVFELPPLWAEIEALDNKVPAAVQTEMLLEIAGLVEHAAAWLLRANRLDIGREIAASRARLCAPRRACRRAAAGGRARRSSTTRAAGLAAAGVPQALGGAHRRR